MLIWAEPLGSSRALDAREPVSEEARRSSGCSWGSACPASSTTASEPCGQWSTSANSGPEVALLLVDQLDLTGYYAFHATRADLLHRSGRYDQALVTYETAAALATSTAERNHLIARVATFREKARSTH
jgi:hypothetical protein